LDGLAAAPEHYSVLAPLPALGAGEISEARMSQNEQPEEARIRRLTETYAAEAGALLPILHAIQDELGYVPESAVPIVAEVLNLSRAEVHGVVTFYHFFRTKPPGKKTLYVCRAEACQSMGARALEAYARNKLGVDFHGTTADGRFSLEPVYCLGNCACSPAVMVDETVYGRVTPQRLDEILA
jgi:formate dehydrogenase subunit gamma